MWSTTGFTLAYTPLPSWYSKLLRSGLLKRMVIFRSSPGLALTSVPISPAPLALCTLKSSASMRPPLTANSLPERIAVSSDFGSLMSPQRWFLAYSPGA
ncbi:hypothetical protein D9M68_583070 [compost metagenome]